MKKRILFFCLVSLMALFIASKPTSQQANRSIDKDLQKIARRISSNGWVYFKEKFKTDPKKFFSVYKKEFNLSKDDEMKLFEEGSDSLFKFFKFKRYYKGILVEGSDYTLKYKDDNLELAIGRGIKSINIDINNIIKSESALKEVIKNSKATKFAWQDDKWESSIKKENNDSSATWFPKATLVFTKMTSGEYTLAYLFDVVSTQPKIDHALQYVDAHTGKFIKEKSLSFEAISPGITYYNGEKYFTTYYISGHWRLQDRTRGIFTAKLNQSPEDYDWNNYPYLDDWDNYWDWESERPAVSALWATETAYDFYHTTFGRHGINNNNRTINITTGYPYDNAGFTLYSNLDHDYLTFGYHNGMSLTALDIVGHEYSHGVINYVTPLEYVAAESGALNESFADFFGECIENYADGPSDWLCGADVGTVRSMISPTDYGQPAYWHGTNWYYGGNVGSYVHINSGVPNKAFYLMTHGDSGLGISGIGFSYAANTAYRALNWYLNEDATFAEARDAFLDAALYYGNECSSIYKDVMNSWAAVGIGNPSSNPCFDVSYINIDAYAPICDQTATISIEVSGGSGSYSYEWRINGNLESTNPSFSYWFSGDSYTEYYIDLIVSDGVETRTRSEYTYADCGYSRMDQADTLLLSVYPNPSTEFASIEIIQNNKSMSNSENLDYEISIIDNTGRKVLNTKTRSNKLDINMQGYQKGSYLILVTKGKYKGTSQIIKN